MSVILKVENVSIQYKTGDFKGPMALESPHC